MKIDIKARVRCEEWGCQEIAEVWAEATLNHDGERIESIDVPQPEGWRRAGASYDGAGLVCPKHAGPQR